MPSALTAANFNHSLVAPLLLRPFQAPTSPCRGPLLPQSIDLFPHCLQRREAHQVRKALVRTNLVEGNALVDLPVLRGRSLRPGEELGNPVRVRRIELVHPALYSEHDAVTH